MYPRDKYIPKSQLSPTAIREEFLIPTNTLGDQVANNFDIVWIFYNGDVMPAIYNKGVYYPGHRPATKTEIEAYRNLHTKQA